MEENLQTWKNLGTIIRLEARREVQGKVTLETRYYLSDEKEDSAAYFCLFIRGHWSIENQLHWHLDITVKEDACRAKTGYTLQNLSVLRKMALHVSEQDDKLSIKKRLYKAALDISYLKTIENLMRLPWLAITIAGRGVKRINKNNIHVVIGDWGVFAYEYSCNKQEWELKETKYGGI